MVILKHPQFDSQDAASNIRRLRSRRTRLPLLPVKSHSVVIDDRKTPSTSNPTKLAYTISIKEHLNHILNNPRLMEKMYFGRGIKTPEKSELWHGDIWQRSSLYGDATISIDNGKTRSMTLFDKTLLICFQWNTLWENL